MKPRHPLAVKAVTIDLDGTLLDTVPDLALATNSMLEAFERPVLEAAQIRTFVGKGISRLVERALAGAIDGVVAPELLAKALPVYERIYAAVNGRHTTLYPGVLAGLEAFQAMGIPLACVTNKLTRFTLPLLEHMKLSRYFSEVICGDTLAKKKPDPAPLLYACEKFGVPPGDMLMIGDSLNDAQAARAAGCPVFCVSYGYNEGGDVRQLDIDAIVDSLIDASRLIRKAE